MSYSFLRTYTCYFGNTLILWKYHNRTASKSYGVVIDRVTAMLVPKWCIVAEYSRRWDIKIISSSRNGKWPKRIWHTGSETNSSRMIRQSTIHKCDTIVLLMTIRRSGSFRNSLLSQPWHNDARNNHSTVIRMKPFDKATSSKGEVHFFQQNKIHQGHECVTFSSQRTQIHTVWTVIDDDKHAMKTIDRFCSHWVWTISAYEPTSAYKPWGSIN